jgi:hypothetical protein
MVLGMIDTKVLPYVDAALRAAGIPIYGVDSNGVVAYQPSATQAQQTQGAAIVATFPTGSVVLRTPYALAVAIAALTTGQWNNIVADLFSGNPAKWQVGASEAMSAGAMFAITNTGVITFGNKFQQVTMTALYVRQFPYYLVTPSFDSSINVPGYQ